MGPETLKNTFKNTLKILLKNKVATLKKIKYLGVYFKVAALVFGPETLKNTLKK